MTEGTTDWFEHGGKTMRVQHIAGDLYVDFRVDDHELEGALQVLEAEKENPGLTIHAVALGFAVVKAVIDMVETGEWKKHFPEVDEDAG